MVLGEVVRAARAITLVLQMSDDAHVAEAMTAGRQEGILDDAHTDRAKKVLILLDLRPSIRGDARACLSRHASGGVGSL